MLTVDLADKLPQRTALASIEALGYSAEGIMAMGAKKIEKRIKEQT